MPPIKLHLSQQFETELQEVRSHLLAMGGLVENQVTNALQALKTFDNDLAHEVTLGDVKVNEFELKIDHECINIIELHQLNAIDLRLIASILKTINDLERVGDEAARIARVAINLSEQQGIQINRNYHSLFQLGDQVQSMVHDALDAIARVDVEQAVGVAKKDRKVDDDYKALLHQLMGFMLEDASAVSHMVDMMWIARALERIGDHARNICQHLIYLVEGKDVRHLSIEQTERMIHSD